ncbi:MAG TPA: glycosyltransferase family 4 protein [Solirubrobacteraceae bacterium]|nr:glycosyltransferase family 4 protein [Solirubrobacteraceae bacterium]
MAHAVPQSAVNAGATSIETTRSREQRLMVVIPDRLSHIVSKGEITERYYNPGDLFKEVHIVMTNDDRPSAEALQPMVGTADLHLHNVPADGALFRRTIGWRPRLVRPWARQIVALADQVQPQLIRCHGAHLNSFAASEVRRILGVPYLVSMHINPDSDLRRHWKVKDSDWRARLELNARVSLERAALRNADCVVCVYRFIEPYARRMGARRVEVIYNVIGGGMVVEKRDYALRGSPRVIVPGRQFDQKDPRPVLEALESLPGVQCTFVGDGPLHGELVERARGHGLDDRAHFVRALPNDELRRTLPDYDVLVSVNDYGGVSKVELEAALAGMPIITNRHPLEDEPEILGAACLVVDGDAESYRDALRRLIDDEDLRIRLGEQVRENAGAIRPEIMEQSYVALYRDLLRPERA